MTSESGKRKRNPVSYSIWLMPEDNLKDRLKNKIQLLASDFDGPIFEPHVSIVSGFLGEEKILLDKTEIISKKIPPFKILFNGVAYLDDFFRSLFLKVKNSPQLISTRELSATELGWKENNYLPHLSLIYGNYTVKQKKIMVSRLGSVTDNFSVKNIYLAHNDEINLKWKIVRAFPLSN